MVDVSSIPPYILKNSSPPKPNPFPQMIRLPRLLPLLFGLLLTSACTLFSKPNKPMLSGSLHSETFQHQNIERQFTYYRPKDLQENSSLIFVLHSSNGTAAQIRALFGYRFDQIAQQKNAIIVYPQGLKNHWNDCRKSGPYYANKKNIDDVDFIKQLISLFHKRHSIADQGTFATGLSNGGNFALRLALELPQEISAVAAIGTNFPSAENFDCQHSSIPMSFLLINGTADPINPYHGGMVSLHGFGKRGTVMSSEKTIEYWLRNAGIRSPPTEKLIENQNTYDQTQSIHKRWQNSQTLVELITVQGGGHNIPHPNFSPNPIFGPHSKDYWAADLVYDFFQRSSKR